MPTHHVGRQGDEYFVTSVGDDNVPIGEPIHYDTLEEARQEVGHRNNTWTGYQDEDLHRNQNDTYANRDDNNNSVPDDTQPHPSLRTPKSLSGARRSTKTLKAPRLGAKARPQRGDRVTFNGVFGEPTEGEVWYHNDETGRTAVRHPSGAPVTHANASYFRDDKNDVQYTNDPPPTDQQIAADDAQDDSKALVYRDAKAMSWLSDTLGEALVKPAQVGTRKQQKHTEVDKATNDAENAALIHSGYSPRPGEPRRVHYDDVGRETRRNRRLMTPRPEDGDEWDYGTELVNGVRVPIDPNEKALHEQRGQKMARRQITVRGGPEGRVVSATDENGSFPDDLDYPISFVQGGKEGREEATNVAQQLHDRLQRQGHDVHVNDDKKTLSGRKANPPVGRRVQAHRNPGRHDPSYAKLEEENGMNNNLGEGTVQMHYPNGDVRVNFDSGDYGGVLRDPEYPIHLYDAETGEEYQKRFKHLRTKWLGKANAAGGTFTGVVKDSQGRTICFRNGVRVRCPKNEKKGPSQQGGGGGATPQAIPQGAPSGGGGGGTALPQPAQGQIGMSTLIDASAVECEWYVSGGKLNVYDVCTLSSFTSLNRALRDGQELDASQATFHARLMRAFGLNASAGEPGQKAWEYDYDHLPASVMQDTITEANDPKSNLGGLLMNITTNRPGTQTVGAIRQSPPSPNTLPSQTGEMERAAAERATQEPGYRDTRYDKGAKSLGVARPAEVYRGMDFTTSPELSEQFLQACQKSLQTAEPMLLTGYTPCTTDANAEFYGNFKVAVRAVSALMMGQNEALLPPDCAVVVRDLRQNALGGWDVVTEQVDPQAMAPEQPGPQDGNPVAPANANPAPVPETTPVA